MATTDGGAQWQDQLARQYWQAGQMAPGILITMDLLTLPLSSLTVTDPPCCGNGRCECGMVRSAILEGRLGNLKEARRISNGDEEGAIGSLMLETVDDIHICHCRLCTQEDDGYWLDVVARTDGSVVLAGYAFGNWSGDNHGYDDFMVSVLDVGWAANTLATEPPPTPPPPASPTSSASSPAPFPSMTPAPPSKSRGMCSILNMHTSQHEQT